MLGTALALGISAGVSALSGIGNAVANMSAADRASALQDKGLQEWLKIHIPDPEEQKIALQKFVSEGQLNPKLEQAIKQNPSEFKNVVSSVSNRNAQNRALSELGDMGYQGGLRLQDKATLQDAMLNGQVKDRANREAITADMARRGMGGSGFEFASQLAGQQSGADRDARSSLSVAAQAQDRALQSIMGAGDMAGKMQSQDFQEQSAKAQAQDAINRFNTSNLQDVQSRNVGTQNRAQEMNLSEKQRIADANVNQSNQEQQYNKGLIQQQFDNQARVAAGKSGQYGQMAANETAKGQALGNAITNVGQGVSGAATSQANQDYWTNYFNKNKANGK